jgi:hypothetical protein
MKHKWSLPVLRRLRRAPQHRRDDATDIFRAFVHRLERLRALSRSQMTTDSALADKA